LSAKGILGDAIVRKLRDAMDAQRLDAVLPMAPENVAYVAGVVPPSLRTVRSRLACCVVPAEGRTELIVIALEQGAVEPHNRLDELTTYREFEQDAVTMTAASLRDRGLGGGRIGIETTYLPKASFDLFEEALPNARLVPIDDLLAEVRSIKTPEEIDAIADIGAHAQRIGEECLGLVAAGETEAALGELITERYEGIGGRLTMLVVGSGTRSALANAPPTDKVIERGDVVRIDVIGIRANYCSDVARTAVVGEPSDEQVRVYGLLRQAHERILERLRPAAMTDELYSIYRDGMEAAGLPYYHFVGHGLGITLHEDPFISDRRPTALAPGMVLCIEPMSLLEGRYGMQIEDEILITEDGSRPLTRAGDLIRIDAE
jgi:Xaa-Pro dipeptidase